MSIYALLRNAVYRGQLTIADVELEGVLDGNLCRCTGYKPILDAAKSFVGDYTRALRGASFLDPGGVDELGADFEDVRAQKGRAKNRSCLKCPSTTRRRTWTTRPSRPSRSARTGAATRRTSQTSVPMVRPDLATWGTTSY